MKTILIATDFSPAARNATQYGLRLAEVLQAKPILFSAWQQVPVLMPDALVTLVPADNQRMVLTQLETEARMCAKDREASIETLTKEGPIVPAILEAARETQAELILVGMKAHGHVTRRLFGSTVTALAGKTGVPLLVVPETTLFTPIHIIGLAEDIRWENGRPTPKLIERFMQEFHCRLFLIRVYNKQSGEVIEVLHHATDESRMIGSFKPLREVPASGDIAFTLANFIATNAVDILVMRPHPKTMPERWFSRSHTREILFETKIPVLILPLAAGLAATPSVSLS